MPAKQQSFLPKLSLQHGGDLREGKRKIARPLDPKRPLHVTLFSSRATGEWSLRHPRNAGRVHVLIDAVSERHGVKVYRQAIVGNHLHLLVQTRSRRAFQGFLRELAGMIASVITGATKGNPCGRFWSKLAWSRIVSWGRDVAGVHAYLIKNALEAFGALDRKGRDSWLKLRPAWTGPPGDFGPDRLFSAFLKKPHKL